VTTSAPLAHERAFELLPWLVNGTLEPAERDAVEHHARACIACRRELKEQLRLHAAVRSQPAVHVSVQAGFDELDRQIAGASRERRRSKAWVNRYAALRPFAVAAAAGVALLAFLLWLTPPENIDPARYATLGAPADDAVLIDIVFAQETTAAEMTTVLAEIGGEIVAGPSAAGRYRVRVAPATDEAGIKRVLDALGKNPRVRFAGRSLAEIPP
jgi:hypothetical protein